MSYLGRLVVQTPQDGATNLITKILLKTYPCCCVFERFASLYDKTRKLKNVKNHNLDCQWQIHFHSDNDIDSITTQKIKMCGLPVVDMV